MHISSQQLKDHIQGSVLVVAGFCFGVWIWRNFPTRGGRAMSGPVIVGSLLLSLCILYYDLMHR